MGIRLKQYVAEHRTVVEDALATHLPVSQQRCSNRYNEALHYAVFPGGKRWRPLLTLLGGKLVNAPMRAMLPAACAIEFLHTSSMIVDDLPAMDDADLRRGKPSLHLSFGESTALLVALGLMNSSYALLSKSCDAMNHPAASAPLIAAATQYIGSDGMIGGQLIDLELRDDAMGLDALHCRNLKTTALMRLMMTTGAIAAGADDSAINALASFGESVGSAYQICDDLLDEVSSTHQTGKPCKQDQRHLRPSFVTEYGLNGAIQIAQEILADGKAGLRAEFGDHEAVQILFEASDMILGMNHLPLCDNSYDLVTAS